MILPNWLYDLLKWVCLLCLPAFKTAIPKFFELWHLPLGNEIAQSLDILAVLLGSLLGMSCATYSNSPEVPVISVEDGDHQVEADNDTDKG